MNRNRTIIWRPFGRLGGAFHGLALGLLASAALTQQVAADPFSYELRQTDALAPFSLPQRSIFAESRLRGDASVSGLLADSPLAPSFSAAAFSSMKLRSRIADSNAASSALWTARAAFLPKITASLDLQKSNQILTGTPATETRTLGLDFSMPLFAGGTRYFGMKQAEAASHAADYGVLAEGNALMADTASSYFAVISARERYKALLGTEDRVARLAEITRARRSQGFAGSADVSLSEAELSGIRGELEAARETIRNAEFEYTSKTGDSIPLDVGQSGPDLLQGYDVADLVNRALYSNPNIMQADYSSKAAEYDVRSTVGKYLPRVDLNGGYQRYMEPALADKWTVGVKLTVPLVDATSVPEVRRKRFEAASARYAAADTRREIEGTVRRAWNAYQGAGKQAALEQDRLNQLSNAATAKRKQYSAGFADLSDVLSIENTILRSRMTLADLLATQQTSAYKLAISAGL